jgi:surface antigen/LysM repeat protein
VRYGLLVGNLAVVVVAALVVLRSPNSTSIARSSINKSNSQAINPLDTLTSADIAVNAARIINLTEAVSVTNQADSVAAELNNQIVDYAVVPKPQILSSVIKTKADIKDYTVVEGDGVGDLASRFGVTSDSIKWTNSLSTNTLRVGAIVSIPPVDGIVYTVKAGDTAESLASKYSANKEQIIAFNDAEVSGLKVGERIVVPGGSIPPPPPVVYTANYSYNGPSFSGPATPVTAVYGGNGYVYGNCTWYVSNRRAELGRPVPNNLGNAYSWYTVAQYSGMPTGSTPQFGAVGVLGNHVVVVEQLNDDGSFWVSEMNYYYGQRSMEDASSYGGLGRKDFRLVRSAGGYRFIY